MEVYSEWFRRWWNPLRAGYAATPVPAPAPVFPGYPDHVMSEYHGGERQRRSSAHCSESREREDEDDYEIYQRACCSHSNYSPTPRSQKRKKDRIGQLISLRSARPVGLTITSDQTPDQPSSSPSSLQPHPLQNHPTLPRPFDLDRVTFSTSHVYPKLVLGCLG